MSKRTRTRTALFSGIALAALALVAVPAALRAGDADAEGSEAEPLPVPVSTAEAAVMWRCGLDPEALAAAGLSASDTSGVTQDALAYLAANPKELPDADAVYAAARVERDALERKVRSGLASAQEVADCQAAIAAFDAAEKAREAAVGAIVTAAEADLTLAQRALLATIRKNRARWRLPLQYLVVERTDEAWLQLRDALDNERISADYEEEPDAALQAHLATVNAEPAVSSAKASLDASLGAVITAWNAALSG